MSKQLKAILWKNYLLKITHPWSTAAELFLPVIFMALLILIKQITSSYNSPNVAYSCGNAFPWSYTTYFDSSNVLSPSSAVNCLLKPDVCHESNYYQSGFYIEDTNIEPLKEVKLYSEYGYIDSASSSGSSTNPFYSKFIIILLSLVLLFIHLFHLFILFYLSQSIKQLFLFFLS